MRLVWGRRNLEKIQAHGLSSAEVESAFDAKDWATTASDKPYRFVGKARRPQTG